VRCTIVGAGLLGLTTAWFLRRHGLDVEVLESGAGPGLGTSFANGGMLHASQASPWNEPGVLAQVLKTFGREDSALLIRPRALLGMLPWAWQFFRNARPQRFNENLLSNARLAAYSLTVLERELSSLPLDFDRAGRGTLKVYRTAAELDNAARVAARCRDWDVAYTLLDAAGIAALEPALAPITDQLSGGIHFPGDVSGDAHKFCCELARCCEQAGVAFEYGANVERFLVRGACVQALIVNGVEREIDSCVVAAGSNSARLLATARVRVPIQPVKGYSLTLPTDSWAQSPAVPVIDEHFHAAVCPLGTRLRVAGTAEFAGFDATLSPGRVENLFTLLQALYPVGAAGVDRQQCQQWAAFRPMSPDGVGLMGETPCRGLFINAGHGHLGWTMAPGAGKLVADCVAGVAPEIDPGSYLPARF